MSTVKISKTTRKKPIYAFDNVTNATEVSTLIDKIRRDLGVEMNKVRIFVLSGTHGAPDGSLTGDRIFFMEDRSNELQTVTAINVNQNTPVNTWNSYFVQTGAILILAWCFSSNWGGLAMYNK